MRKVLVRRVPASLRNSRLDLLFKPELIVGEGLTDLGILTSRWIMRHKVKDQATLLIVRNQELTITLTTRRISRVGKKICRDS